MSTIKINMTRIISEKEKMEEKNLCAPRYWDATRQSLWFPEIYKALLIKTGRISA